MQYEYFEVYHMLCMFVCLNIEKEIMEFSTSSTYSLVAKGISVLHTNLWPLNISFALTCEQYCHTIQRPPPNALLLVLTRPIIIQISQVINHGCPVYPPAQIVERICKSAHQLWKWGWNRVGVYLIGFVIDTFQRKTVSTTMGLWWLCEL